MNPNSTSEKRRKSRMLIKHRRNRRNKRIKKAKEEIGVKYSKFRK